MVVGKGGVVASPKALGCLPKPKECPGLRSILPGHIRRYAPCVSCSLGWGKGVGRAWEGEDGALGGGAGIRWVLTRSRNTRSHSQVPLLGSRLGHQPHGCGDSGDLPRPRGRT